MTLPPLVLDPEQEWAVRKMAASPTRSAMNCSELGRGKTVMAVELARALQARTVLVIGPLHTRYGWQDTFERQGAPVPFHKIGRGNKAERTALDALHAGTPGIYFAGREWFRLQDWSKVRVDMVIWDECHVLQDRKSRGGRALRTLKRGYTLLQSATPFGTFFEGAWGVTRHAFPDHVDRSYWAWVDEYCQTSFDPFSASRKRIVGEREPGRFFSELPCAIRLEAKNTSEPVFKDVYVDLGRKQRAQYKQMEQEMIAWLGENPLVAELPIVKRVRLRQFTLGEATLDEEGNVNFDIDTESPTIDTLEQILSDLGNEKVLIGTDSSKFAAVVAQRIDAFAWIGDASQAERETAKKAFIEGELQAIVAHPAAIAEGTDGLQHACHVLITLSESDSPVLNQQFVGRLNRSGQKKQVVVIRIRRRGTIDDPQAESLLAKELAMRASVALAA